MKYVWIAIIVAVLVGIWVWVSGRTTEETPPAADGISEVVETEEEKNEEPTDEGATTEARTVEIIYTDSGFSPASVTIKAGDSVRFTNQSSGSFWPASNPHPVHTTYGEFDANKAIAAGQSYVFTFTKAGRWGFHDHLDSNKEGTVIVE